MMMRQQVNGGMRRLGRWLLAGVLGLALLAGPLPAARADSFEVGLRLYGDGQYAQAVTYFQQAAWQADANPNAAYYLANTYLKLNRLADAQAEYQKVLALAPQSQAARMSRQALSRLHAYLDGTIRESSGLAGRLSGRHTASARSDDRYQGPIGSDHYFDQVTDHGKVVRWALSRMPLKIYVDERPQGIRNFQPAFPAQIRRALEVWAGVLNHQLSYQWVGSSDAADLRVTWVNTLDTRGHHMDGGTAYTAGVASPVVRGDELLHMDVKIATFDIEGQPQTPETVYAVAVHELGHALGLMGHSDHPGDIMFAQNQRITQPSPRDINTLRKLYSVQADVTNLPSEQRHQVAGRDQELARKLDESIRQMESQAQREDRAISWLNLGVAYFQKARQGADSGEGSGDVASWFAKSLAAFGQAIEKEPLSPLAYHRRSLVYQAMGDYRLALADVRQAIRLDRREPEYYLLQAGLLARQGQRAEARASLDTYLGFKPGEAGSVDVRQVVNWLSSPPAAKGR